MHSDDIYKIIGYTVAVMFFIYVILRVLNMQFDIVNGLKKKVKEGLKDKDKDKDKDEDKDKDDEDDNKKDKTSEDQQTAIDEYLDGIEKRNDKKERLIGFGKNQGKFKSGLREEINGCEYDILNILIQTGKKGELSEDAQKNIATLKIKMDACRAVLDGI